MVSSIAAAHFALKNVLNSKTSSVTNVTAYSEAPSDKTIICHAHCMFPYACFFSYWCYFNLELIGDFYEDLHVLILRRSGLEHYLL